MIRRSSVAAVDREQVERVDAHQVRQVAVALGQVALDVQLQHAASRSCRAARGASPRPPIAPRRPARRRPSPSPKPEEQHAQAGEVEVRVGDEPRAGAVVVDLRRRGQREHEHAVRVGLEQAEQEGADLARPRVGARRAGTRRPSCSASAGRTGARSRRSWWATGCSGPSRRAAGRRASSRPGTAAPGAS